MASGTSPGSFWRRLLKLIDAELATPPRNIIYALGLECAYGSFPTLLEAQVHLAPALRRLRERPSARRAPAQGAARRRPLALGWAPMARPTLVYFAARGRAEVIRLVLAEAGVEYDEHLVAQDTPPANGRPTDFAALKATGDLPFGAVPVWEEPGGFRLSQSQAIACHLARAHGLEGKGPAEKARIDEVLGGVEDLRGELRKLFLVAPGERAALRAELAASTLPRWLGYFERPLGRNGGGDWAVGSSLSVADLSLFYVLEMIRDNGLVALDRFPRLAALFEKVASRPRIAAYLASPGRPKFTPLPA
jgi:glutathione S-transferase